MTRICDIELIKNRWLGIETTQISEATKIKNYILSTFSSLFKIEKIYLDDVGYILIKVYLKAIKSGKIENVKSLGVSIIVKEKEEKIRNEIKKNYLIFDRKNKIQLRVDDTMIFYGTTNK